MTDDVLYEVRDQVAWITINRPEARNALNKAARDGLRAAFERFAADDDAAVAVLTGAGSPSRSTSSSPPSTRGARSPRPRSAAGPPGRRRCRG